MNRTHLLKTDQQQSSLGARAYLPYGLHHQDAGPLLAFAGQPADTLTGCYHLGNGRRTYNPVLMRFHSADRLSPFGRGGIHAYAYCGNDPVNFTDPAGQFPQWIRPVQGMVTGLMNLGITLFKYFKDYRSQKVNFMNDPEYAASRDGVIATGSIENEIPKLDWKENVLAAVGGVTAVGSMLTSGTRLGFQNSETLMTIDAGLWGVATLSSIAEGVILARRKMAIRNPILDRPAVYSTAAPTAPGGHSPIQNEWQFPTSSSQRGSRRGWRPQLRRQVTGMATITSREIRETRF
ncbi:RHS repeat-associated core domain-containing protein [Pseudomonas putida]